ncbi:MAG: HAD-IIIA family hydrolase [Patescibacteria group bacterium]
MKTIKQAVILAGGKGVRLRPLTLKTPKPMIKIHGKPFLEYIIELLKNNRIEKVLILTGYLHEQIENYFRDGREFGLSISYLYSPIEDDTGTRVQKAKDLIEGTFLLLYSDNYWPLRLGKLYSFYKKKKKEALVTVYSNLDNYTKNNILVSDKGFVEVYDESRQAPGLNGVDIGFFILNKDILKNLPKENFSFEKIVIPELIAKKELAGFLTHHKYYGLSNPERIPAIEDFFIPKKVVFLDRDGVINKRPPKAKYITSWDEFEFLPKVKDALRLLKKKAYIIFIATNQPGIARKMLTENQLNNIHKKLIKELEKIEVEIKDIFVCMHGWDEGCFCRKPKPGIFFEAAAKYNINLFKSYYIGDDTRDIIAGNMAGCKTFLANSRNSLYSIVSKYL